MKWWKRGGRDDASSFFSKDVHIVKNDHYQTKIIVERAPSMTSSSAGPHHQDARVGSNFDEPSLGENSTHRHSSTKRILHTRKALYIAISTCLFTVVIIILSVGLAKDLFWDVAVVPEASNESPIVSKYSASGEEEERAKRLHDYLSKRVVHGAAGFNDPISPESQALAWMQRKDELALDPDETENRYRIDQRFALVTLWFQSEYEWLGQNNWLSGHECTWEGVLCVTLSPENRSLSKAADSERDLQQEGDQVVTELYLAQYNLQGNLPPNLHLLTNLTSLNLSGNRIQGEIPQSYGELIWLEELQLQDNNLSQGLSLDFSRMSNLMDVNLSNNQLEGTIPASLYMVSSMSRIQLDNNQFTGEISKTIRNLANLHTFTAGGNQLRGDISTFSKIGSLAILMLKDNHLSGQVDLVGMNNLNELVLENNKFSGPLPDLSDSPGIQVLRLGNNRFDNLFFPTNYLEMTNMANLGLNNLRLTGEIPAGIGTLTNLKVLNLEGNSLNGILPLSLTEVSTLQDFTVHNNRLSGTIPFEISYLTDLERLTLSSNQLESTVPTAIRRLTSLKTLTMASNNLDGQILNSIGFLSDLEILDLAGNEFTGFVPDSFSELTSLREVNVADNYFAGRIPGSIGNLKLLQVLNAASNAFRGRIPQSIASLTDLEVLDLSFNFFGGPIPNNVGDLLNLRELLLGSNLDESNAAFGLDGTIPASIANMHKLEKLEINRNRISGFLPSQHKFLNTIQIYDVSDNEKLGGTIPKDFSNMTQLSRLNIFGTNIDGMVPINFCYMNVTVRVDCGGATTMKCSCCLCHE